jgi:glycosyltransferase involved in cell wall biosynthesis
MPTYDLVCLSHLRWDFVFQRPHHLLTRAARERRVFVVEEPLSGGNAPTLEITQRDHQLWTVVPRLPAGLSPAAVESAQRQLLDHLCSEHDIRRYVLWYYTPMALSFSRHLKPLACVYDCMDELAAFKFAPPELRAHETELFRRADLVFTGGQSLYEAKRQQHARVYAFPSSVDVPHFAQARERMPEPADQAPIGRPRLGFFGVLDERLDLDLVSAVTTARPDWQVVMVGPVAKIAPDDLPSAPNLHYLGPKTYAQLPAYIAGWDVALLPFALNDSTRFISPTKTPEYLAAGRPVVSTPIKDVVRPYGESGLVQIADSPSAFIAAIDRALAEDTAARQQQADELLARMSWDQTWQQMAALIDEHAARGAIHAMPPLATARVAAVASAD